MRHRSKSFACNVVFMIFGLRRFHSLPCGFMRFHHTTIHFLGILGCNFRIRNHLSWCHFEIFYTASRSRFFSVVERCRVLASRFSILVVLDSGRPYQCSSIVLAIRDLFSQSFELLSISPRTTKISWDVFLLIAWILWILTKNLTNFCSKRHSSSHQYVFLARRPDQYGRTWLHQCISVE